LINSQGQGRERKKTEKKSTIKPFPERGEGGEPKKYLGEKYAHFVPF